MKLKTNRTPRKHGEQETRTKTNMADDGDGDEDVRNGFDGIEEDDSDTDSDTAAEIVQEEEEDQAGPSKMNFDPSLPARHQYLGEEMEEFSGRTLLEADHSVTLPLLTLPGLILVPGQTLPLHLFQPMFVSMMKNVIEKDRTFGLVNARYNGNQGQLLAAIGTTAEIFSMKEEVEGGITTMRVKAMGRQRFRIGELRRQIDGVLMATCHILPEVSLPSHPEGSLWSCYHATGCHSHPRTDCELTPGHPARNWLRKLQYKKVSTSVSRWPQWVYEMYNPYTLVKYVKKELKSWSESLRVDNLPKAPSEFSFWVAANIPLDDSLRLHLLDINCPIQRLRRELEIMQKYSILCCRDCDRKIVNKSDLFSMSLDGPLGAYVNPNGWVHETLTFYKAEGIRLRGKATAENSWFPGYAWTIAECAHCMQHVGWRFTAVKKGLSPSKFWGLTRTSLRPSMRYSEDSSSGDRFFEDSSP